MQSTGAVNVVPGECVVPFNIRYNPKHTAASLEEQIEDYVPEAMFGISGLNAAGKRPPFFGKAFLRNGLAEAIKDVTGIKPEFSTSGGTSGGGFIRQWCLKL